MLEEAQGIFRELSDRHREGQTLMNMGVLYEKQGQKEKAIALWQEALSKLHMGSPEHRQVAEWLQSAKPRGSGVDDKK